MRTRARRLAGTAVLLPVALLAGACSGGGGTDTTDITRDADLSDGTLAGDHLDDGLAELADWQDMLPDQDDDQSDEDDQSDDVESWDADEDDVGDDEDWSDWDTGSGLDGIWFPESGDRYMGFYSDGTGYIFTNTTDYTSCDGTYESLDDSSYDISFTACPSPYGTGTGELSGGVLTVTWADGSTETYRQDSSGLPDDGGSGGGGEGNAGAEIEGLWSGDDGSTLGVMSEEMTEEGLANVSYLDASGDEECGGILTQSADDSWLATMSCGAAEDGDVRFADLVLDGEVLNLSWRDGGSVDYTWDAEW